MPIGPGKYDDILTEARNKTGGSAILIVIGGIHGAGFAVQATIDVTLGIPRLLRDTANKIEQDLRR